MSNPFVYSQLVMRGSWPDAGLERMVRNREFDLIVTQWNYPMYPNFMSDGAERFSSGVVQAIVKNYRAVQMYQCTDARVSDAGLAGAIHVRLVQRTAAVP